jgi:hypothetical protein
MTRSMRLPAHTATLIVVGVLSTLVLVLTAGTQIYDTNFQTLWEATELLAGDHPYRDFFEWGLPLQAIVSAGAQVLTGHRLIGEFLVQWIFIVAGVVIACHLGLQLSRSVAASLVAMSLAVILLAVTPTYHYPKLFFYPLAVWLSWRYLDQPDATRGALLGLTTALAFLFRHDHGVYIGVLAVVTFALARVIAPSSRTARSMLVESGAYTSAAALVLLPWAVMVQLNEGLSEYVRARTYLYSDWSASESPYLALLNMNPLRTVLGDRSPAPRPAGVSFTWSGDVDDAARTDLERRHALRALHQGPDESGRWRYEVPDVYAADLWELRGEMENPDSAEGFDWEQLERLQAPPLVPTREAAQTWLYHLALLVPVVLLIAAGLDAARTIARGQPVSRDACRMTAAAAFLFAMEGSVFREPSYVMLAIPFVFAVSTPFLADWRPSTPVTPLKAIWLAARASIVAIVLSVTVLSTFAYAKGSGIFELHERVNVAPVFRELMTVPAIDAFAPPAEAHRYDRDAWTSGTVDRGRLLIRYMHDCTRPDDRILVTGSTPYHVNYYTNRRVAGGHLFWHHGWRSDPVREQALLALLQHQSVPFAFSTHDPVLADLKRYPRIYEYFSTYYVELDGSRGLLLVDTRRQPTNRFGLLGFPCFR